MHELYCYPETGIYKQIKGRQQEIHLQTILSHSKKFLGVCSFYSLLINGLADFSMKGSCETSKELEDRVGIHRLTV